MADERDQIRERLPIETLVGEHVALSRAGRILKGLCPFHKEKTPSFIVSPDRGSFHCFGCNAGGDIFRFYMLLNKVEFPDALRALAARTGVELDPDAARRKSAEVRAHEVLAAVTLYFQQALAGNAGKPARAYLAQRGLSRETIERFALGYLPDWGEGLRRELPARGVGEQELIDAGVLLPSEAGREPFCAFHQRLIFPIRDAQGRVCGFGGRILGEGQPKYLNSRQSALFDKSAVLYTVDRAAEAIRSAGEAVIVEGYMDALRAHQDGFANVVASLGTAITPRQLTLLSRLTSRVVLALDGDPAGARAAAEAGVRAMIALRQERSSAPVPFSPSGRPSRPPLEVRIATLPAGRDPDEVIAADPAAWRAAIAGAAPAMDYLFDLVVGTLDPRTPTFAQELLAQILPLIGQLPGVGLQQPYLERLASMTRIDTAALRGELARLRGSARRADGRERLPGDRARGGGDAQGRAELTALRQQHPRRDRRTTLEEELLRFLLRQSPLAGPALDQLADLTLGTPVRAAVLRAIVEAHRAPAAAAQPEAGTILGVLDDDARALAETLLAAPTPPVDRAKVLSALRTLVLSLERLAQSERLREQGALLDQVDRETARALLGPTQDLVASRNEVTRRMLEEQAAYHLH
ncbi:MAG TPA: DNA primase [Chloroflexota bacterium]|nr:DNA primase [Chloroflexota bacterium]